MPHPLANLEHEHAAAQLGMLDSECSALLSGMLDGRGASHTVCKKRAIIQLKGDSMSNEQMIEHNFKYHAPKPGQPEIYQEIRQMAKELAYLIELRVPEGREKALAFTKLEEAVMWSNAGIARG